VIGRRQTLALGSGTRRDFALLMMEALRASCRSIRSPNVPRGQKRGGNLCDFV
jgi:hypothetical protein